LLPVIESVKAGEPAGTLDGEMLVTIGAGVFCCDPPPPELSEPLEQPPRMAKNPKRDRRKK
jgi:hypothetical protein